MIKAQWGEQDGWGGGDGHQRCSEVKTASPEGSERSRNNTETPGLLAWATWSFGVIFAMEES